MGFVGIRERVKVALKNTKIEIPPMKITVSISPADMRKEGAAYDLPVAIGILQSLGYIPMEYVKDTLIIGELGLNGEDLRVTDFRTTIFYEKYLTRIACWYNLLNILCVKY